MPPSEDTGFGHPPKEHQFQPGQSGNPRGRPIGAKTRRFGLHGHRLYDSVGAELERPVKYAEDGEVRHMTVLQATVRTLATKAVKGSTEAARILVQLARDKDMYERRAHEKLVSAWATYKAEGDGWIAHLGPNPSPADLARMPFPHPDHIDLDTSSGDILISGPMTEDERDALEVAVRARADIRMAMHMIDARIRTTWSARIRADLLEARSKMDDRVMFLTSVLGDEEDAVGT